MSGRLLAFGEIMLRLSPPGRELLMQTPKLDVWVAGAEANVATALARLGHETGMASPEFDAAMAAALSLADADARREVMVTLETILQDEGYIIQPFWRSLFRHAREGVNVDMHPSFEHHHYKWSVTA